MDTKSSLRGAKRRGNLVKHPEIASSIAMQFPRNDGFLTLLTYKSDNTAILIAIKLFYLKIYQDMLYYSK